MQQSVRILDARKRAARIRFPARSDTTEVLFLISRYYRFSLFFFSFFFIAFILFRDFGASARVFRVFGDLTSGRMTTGSRDRTGT